MPKLIPAGPALAAGLWAGAAASEPLFPNSAVSNDIDFIATDDPAVSGCLRHLGPATREMRGALGADELMAEGVHTFAVAFADGSEVGLWVHPSVGAREEAAAVAALLVGPAGRLPAVMRGTLSHVGRRRRRTGRSSRTTPPRRPRARTSPSPRSSPTPT